MGKSYPTEVSIGGGFYRSDTVSSNWSCSSSIRFKENVVDLAVDMDKFMQLRPVDFDWKEGMGEGPSVGFIAEEVEQIFPEVINYDAETGQAEGVEYRLLTAYNTAVIKEIYRQLGEQNDAFEEFELDIDGRLVEIDEAVRQLEDENDNLKAKTEELEQRLEQLEWQMLAD